MYLFCVCVHFQSHRKIVFKKERTKGCKEGKQDRDFKMSIRSNS